MIINCERKEKLFFLYPHSVHASWTRKSHCKILEEREGFSDFSRSFNVVN